MNELSISEKLIIQAMLPPGFLFLNRHQLETVGGHAMGPPVYYVKHNEKTVSHPFLKGNPFSSTDLNKLVDVCWRVTHNKITTIPASYRAAVREASPL